MNIEVRGPTKAFGPISAVTDLCFEAEAGIVTGFLGPNGAGGGPGGDQGARIRARAVSARPSATRYC